VPKALADKVRAYYSYVVEREVQADEADIITGLSASLRTQVGCNRHLQGVSADWMHALGLLVGVRALQLVQLG
jgi:hypothetical protein